MNAISFSLFGNDPRYAVGAMRNISLAKQLFPGWEVLFYTDNTLPDNVASELNEHKNVRLMKHGEDFDSRTIGYYWRFLAAMDKRYQAVIFRDVDSRLLKRDQEAVDVWLASDKSFHIIRDHPYHTSPIMPGAWGIRNHSISKLMGTFLDSYAMRNIPKAEAAFLQTYMWPLAKDDSVVHDPFFTQSPFPSERKGGEFIGQSFDEHDQPNQDFIRALSAKPKIVPWL